MNKKKKKRATKKAIVKYIIFTAVFLLLFGEYSVIEYSKFFSSLQIRDYPEVNAVASSIKNDCLNETLSWGDENCDFCEFYRVEDYINNNVTYKPPWHFIPKNPVDTIKDGGDCKDKATLAIDLLKSLGHNNIYLVFQLDYSIQAGHQCWAVQYHGRIMFFDCNDMPIVGIRKIL